MSDRIGRAVGLFGLLMAVYLLTYTGHPISGDEKVMFDAAHSFYRDGSLELAYFNDLRPYFPAPPVRPVLSLDVEPLHAYLAAALLWIAAKFPAVGFIHAAWSLNLWVTALTAVILYDFGLTLGYKDRTAMLVALAFGLATIAWPYSTMFFREPLFTLLALLCADALTHWRIGIERGEFRPLWLIMAGGALAGALLTKNIAILLVLPLLVLIAPRSLRRLLLISLGSLVFAGGVFILYQRIAPGVRYRFAWTFLNSFDLSNIGPAISAWLFSPGFSLWIFSPVLLLGFIGVYRLIRARRYREVIFPLVFAVVFMAGYAGFSGWYSGLGWGPRYLVPLTPFLALWLLPVFEDPKPLPLIVWLVIQSVLTQLLAVYVPIEVFSTILFELSLIPWQDGVWTLAVTPLAINLQQLSRISSHIAWIVTGTGAVVIPLCALVVIVSSNALFGSCRGGSLFNKLRQSAAILVAVPMLVLVGLSSFYHDPRLGGNNDAAWQALNRITNAIRPGDALILNDPFYRDFFANYYKSRMPIYMLPLTPSADRESPASVDKTNPETQVHPYTWTLLSRLARSTSRWWYITEWTPFTDELTRANEHFLARHFFPVRELYAGDLIRVIEFAPVEAPPAQIAPVNRIDGDFGITRLIGFDLPRGNEFHAGQVIPVSLLWRHSGWTDAIPPFDYGVNISLVDDRGVMQTQRAGTPIGSFGLMSAWQQGKSFRDNHGLLLPDNIAPGTYYLWVSLYDWRTNQKLPVQHADSDSDHVLLGKITILAD